MITCEACKVLMMGLMDHELSPEEISDVNAHLIRCASCRQEYDEMVKTGKILDLIAFKEPDDEVLERMWNHPFSRFTRWSGIVLVLAGYLVLLGYSMYEFMRDSGEPVLPKIALAAIITGFSILLLSLLRQRATTYKTDKYKEVIR